MSMPSLCDVVAAKLDMVVQSFVFAKAVLHARINRKGLIKVVYV